MSITKKPAARLDTTRQRESDEKITRGPNWLFVRLSADRIKGDKPLADRLWEIAARHFTYRLVLELDELGQLDATVIQQLVILRERLLKQGGALRLCGLQPESSRALKLAARLQHHPDPHTAVGDSWCGGPAEDPRQEKEPDISHQEGKPLNPLPSKPR